VEDELGIAMSVRQPSVPAFDRLMWPCLSALKEMGGSASNDELLAKVIEIETIPEAVASVIHTDNRQTKLGFNLGWAKTYLKRANALENSARGVWAITDFGERMSEQDVDMIVVNYRRQIASGRNEQGERQEVEGSDSNASSELQSWRDTLLSSLRQMDPSAFERLAQRLLRESGFVRVEVTGRSGDGGIDGIGVLRLNLLSFHVLFQCKRYTGSVAAREMRDFRGAMMGRSDKGLFITTGTFTADAKKEATRDGAPAIELIDGDQLCDLLKQLKLGVKIELVEQVTIDTEWFSRV
jgi:restriction system protein